jgi:hypothetical protein
MDVLSRTGPESPGNPAPGSYRLARRDRSMAYVVDSARHQYYEIDNQALQSQLVEMMKARGMKLKFSGFKFDFEDLGEGEVVLGHPTEHWRVRHALTMTTEVGDVAISVITEAVSDNLYAKDIEPEKSPATMGDTAVLTQFRNIIPIEQIGDFRSKAAKLPHGLHLRSNLTSTTSVGDITMATTLLIAVNKVETVDVPASFFEIPSTYKKVEMPRLPGAN